MLVYNIPGRGTVTIKNVVFDYNGTLAVDGSIPPEVREKLSKIKEQVNVYILTADTYGTVAKECSDLEVQIMVFPHDNASTAKKDIVLRLGAEETMCIGNGFNDIEMCKAAALSMAVMEQEGCSGKLLPHCDIIVASITAALDILLKPGRVIATLRN